MPPIRVYVAAPAFKEKIPVRFVYLRHAFGKAAHRSEWEATVRTTDQLVKDALNEVREAIGNGETEEPGPASMELAIRASYPLVVSGRLNADRGSSGNAQPDRRTPGEILDTMRRSIHGVQQLGQALRDFEEGPLLRAVDEVGKIKRLTDGSADQMISDIYLRNEFPPPGRAKAARPGDTPIDHYHNALGALSAALLEVDQTFSTLISVTGDDGQPVVEAQGVEPRLTDSWRELLSKLDEEMVVWARTFRKAYGTKTNTSPAAIDDDDDKEDADPYADVDEELTED